ncbi:MAG: hypothetical protein QXN87_07040 [Candidatus Bathyarchaeia archaeon]
MTVKIEDYIATIEEACGEEKDFIVVFKYDKKGEAIEKILARAKLEKTIAGLVFDLKFKTFSFRLYKTGKVIFKKLRDKNELKEVLAALLS